MLILAHRPFPVPQPYAETGPIFLCGETCARHETGRPSILADTPDDRIVYGTGRIVRTSEIEVHAEALLANPRVAYVLYNSQVPQSAQKRRMPIDALKEWQRQRPGMFRKLVCAHAGCDIQQCRRAIVAKRAIENGHRTRH